MDWRADQRLSELWDIIHMVGGVEDIPISDIRTACDEMGKAERADAGKMKYSGLREMGSLWPFLR